MTGLWSILHRKGDLCPFENALNKRTNSLRKKKEIRNFVGLQIGHARHDSAGDDENICKKPISTDSKQLKTK